MKETPDILLKSQQIGDETIRALADMNIPPKPAYYQVWFSHLEKQTANLSSEIQKKLEQDRAIDEFFLKGIHEKYFEMAHPAKKIEDLARDILRETKSLKSLSEEFSNNTIQFRSDLTDASHNATETGDADDRSSKLLAALLEAAEKAITHNNQLEEDLLAASAQISMLQKSIKIITKDAKTDFLTKLYNRRYFDTAITHLLDASRTEETPLCLIVADIDHFKSFNDKWGHQVGDQVLKLVANVLQENVKGQDLLARYGGEEFIIALPRTTLLDAERLAQNIRFAIAKRKLINRASNEDLGRVTMSFGVAQLRGNASIEELYKAADAALYEAKNTGRNKVVCQMRVNTSAQLKLM